MPTWHTAPWVSELAERLAELASRRDVPAIALALKQASEAHHMDRWLLTQQVASEWDRMGIARVPVGVPLGRVQ